MSATNYLETFDDDLRNEFELLSYEFESLGLSSLEGLYPYKRLLLCKLIDNVHSLIKSHRSLIKEIGKIGFNQTCNQKEIITLNKELKSTNFELSLTKKELRAMQQKVQIVQEQMDECLKEKKHLNENIIKLKKQIKSKENESVHKIKLLKDENESLLQKLSLGSYKRQDEYITEALKKYKLKEEVYKETIKELTNCNTTIMEEVVNLREMIVSDIANRNSR